MPLSSAKFAVVTGFLRPLVDFISSFYWYLHKRLFASFYQFEKAKGLVVDGLVAKRGKYVRPFLHTSMTGLFLIGLAVTPLIRDALPEEEEFGNATGGAVLGESAEFQGEGMTTKISLKPNDTIITYPVQEGDTLSLIAKKYNLTVDTIRWQNDLKTVDSIKPGQKLEIPPIDGVVHRVKRGDTIHSIAKKYSVDAQVIINWPYNSYTDDENFGLAVGQLLVVPDGVMPQEKLWDPNTYIAGRLTPDAGVVSASGNFAWPASGSITQRYVWYHPGVDIANKNSPDILAADAGTVTVAGWPDNYGYGNRVIIDHGNGFTSLYGHLASIYVTPGQTVNRGDLIGKMGSTGRSTGTHLHLEIRYNGANQDPFSYLK